MGNDHVYIKNVPTNTSEEKLKELVGAHGEIKWHKIMRANAGQSRIGATCASLFEMSSEDEVQKIVAALNDKQMDYSELCGPMRVRYAENKAARAATVAEQPAVAGARLSA